MFKKLIAALTMLVIFSTLLVGCFQGGKNDVVALINGREVLRSELERYLDLTRRIVGNNQFSEADQIIILDFYINEQLFYEEAVKRGLEVTPQEIEKELEETKAFLISEYFDEDEQKFQARLDSLNITKDDLRELIRRNLIISSLINSLEEGVEPISDQEIQDFYDENFEEYFIRNERRLVRHILVDTKNVAEALIVRIKQGEDFSKLAQEFSLDTESARNGGDLFFAENGDFVEPFNTVAFTLPVGQLSDVVETRHGFHIIEVLEIRPSEIVELDEELKTEISTFLHQKRRADAINALLDELKLGDTENRLKN